MKSWPLPGSLAGFTVLPLVCIEGHYSEVASELRGLVSSGPNADCWEFFETPFDPKGVFEVAPARGGAHLPKFLLWEPASHLSKTALRPNCEDGLQRTVDFLNRTFG